MTEYLDLTWVKSIDDLRAILAFATTNNMQEDGKKIKLSVELLKHISNVKNNTTSILGWEIYLEDDWSLRHCESVSNNVEAYTIDDLLTLKQKIFEDIDILANNSEMARMEDVEIIKIINKRMGF